MIIKKYILIFLLLPLHFWSQNTAITDDSGALLPTTKAFCPGDSLNLHVVAKASSTGDYTVSAFSGTLSVSGSTVDFPNRSGDNHFSAPIPLPFTFQYYGVNYTTIVVGSNGRIIFGNGTELNNLNTTADAVANQQIPSTAYQIGTSAQVFFGYTQHTYQPSDYFNVVKTSTKINGMDAFGITINGVNPTGYSRKSYQSVYLLSDNSIIIKYMEMDGSGSGSFPSGSLIQQNTVLGLQNRLGTKAKWPSEGADINANDPASPYRYGRWQNTQQAYLFSPSQQLTPKIDWFLNGNPANIQPQPNNNFLNYKPHDGDTVEADVSFLETPTEITKSYIKFGAYVQPTVSATAGTTCGAGTTLAITNPQSGYTYTWISDDAGFSASGSSVAAPKTGTYYAIPNGCKAQKSAPIVVTLASPITPPSFVDGTSYPVCDNLGQTTAPINLLQLVGYTPDANSTVVFTDSSGNTIGNAANNYTMTLTSGMTQNVVMKVTSSMVNCPISKSFSVAYQSFPAQNFSLSLPKLCFGTGTYSVTNFKNDFPQYAGFDVSFSTDHVNFGTNPINPSTNNPIDVKLSKSGFGCTSMANLVFNFYPEIIANDPNIPDAKLQQCASDTQNFDLDDLAKTYINSTGNVIFKYYKTIADAQAGTNPLPNMFRSGMGNTTIFVTVQDKNTGCFAQNIPSFTLTVYPTPKILTSLATTLTNCAGNNIFTLPTQVSDYVSVTSLIAAGIKFFATNGTEISAAQFANFDSATFGTAPYAVISYNSTCDTTVPFTLKFYPKPMLVKTEIPICGQSQYALLDFENYITGNNAANYSFTDANGNALPAIFDVKTSLPTVSVVITDTKTGCKSDVQTVQFVNGSPTPILAKSAVIAPICDTDYDGLGATFDLTMIESQISADTSAKFTFYDATGAIIANPKAYKNQIPFSETVSATVATGENCPTNFTVQLSVTTPTKIVANINTSLCYGDVLNIYISNFNDYKSVTLLTPDGITMSLSAATAIAYNDIIFGKNYTISAVNNDGCLSNFSFMPSDADQPKITQINQTDSQIEVIASGGTQPYVYFFNGISNGSSNIFVKNSAAESYEIFVRSADGCRGPSKFIYNILVYNVITPNSDGYNDSWTVKNLDKMDQPEIIISDRYGKTIFHSTDKNTLIWDGTYDGRILPTASYWYVVKWHDPSTLKDEVRQGWILLKNRD